MAANLLLSSLIFAMTGCLHSKITCKFQQCSYLRICKHLPYMYNSLNSFILKFASFLWPQFWSSASQFNSLSVLVVWQFWCRLLRETATHFHVSVILNHLSFIVVNNRRSTLNQTISIPHGFSLVRITSEDIYKYTYRVYA